MNTESLLWFLPEADVFFLYVWKDKDFSRPALDKQAMTEQDIAM